MLPQRNLLAEEASPYLKQHSGNPVHWRPWSAAALTEAREIDRPILLSVGYAACHWCHVMAHESFESHDVAAVMNRLFVNIKVDREERPDIDQIYMAALSAMGEQGGWPLTMFLMPDARPFWGGTYFPPQPRFGRPGFIQVLEAVDKAWREQRQSLDRSADSLSEHVARRLAGNEGEGELTKNALTELAAGISRMTDRQAGGLRGAPKFPNAPFMQTLWLSWLRDRSEMHRDDVLISLQKMLAGGIYDHLGGGLSRYSTDAEWTVPHFEKMLYDNAQLLRLCNWAFGETQDTLFRIRIDETAAWLLREMRNEDGAFASSFDADSDGQEGLFYTWTEEQIRSVLGDGTGEFFRYFQLVKPSNWEGDPVVRQTPAQQIESIDHQAEVSALKEKLYRARQKRVWPGRDDKVLVDWNGLAIAALAECGRSLSEESWIQSARKAFDSILATKQDGRLPHSILGKAKLSPALSSDYAAMANAGISLFEATQNQIYINEAKALLEQLDRWHQDENSRGYYLTASDCQDVPMRIRGDVDEAIPSATGQIIEALTRFSSVTGDVRDYEKARNVASHAAGRARNQQYGQAGIVNACALVAEPLKLLMIDNREKPAFVPVANRHPDPRRVDLAVALGSPTDSMKLPGETLPSAGKAGAYLCTGQICLPVIDDPTELELLLRGHSADRHRV